MSMRSDLNKIEGKQHARLLIGGNSFLQRWRWAARICGELLLESLDPIDPYMRFGITGALWGDWPNGNLRMSTDMRQIIAGTARFGLQGIEPYARQLGDFESRPLALKQLCAASGISLIDVGDLPPSHLRTKAGSNPRPNPHPNPWISVEGNAELITAMVAFAPTFSPPVAAITGRPTWAAGPMEAQAMTSLRYWPPPSMKSVAKPRPSA